MLAAFTNADEFRQALASGEVQGKLSTPWVHARSRWAVLRKATGWRRPADGE
jgi:hypothetical protein